MTTRRFGANYTPREGWFHAWQAPDFASMRQDLSTLRSLGLDHVRIFPLWPLLQPNRTRIDSTQVEHLLRLVDIAGEEGSMRRWIFCRGTCRATTSCRPG